MKTPIQQKTEELEEDIKRHRAEIEMFKQLSLRILQIR